MATATTIVLQDHLDKLVWLGSNSKTFTVKAMYQVLKIQSTSFDHKFMWKVKLLIEIKIFSWLVLRNNILTKDILRRGWKGSD